MLKVESIYTVYHGIETRSYLLVSDKEAVLIDSGSARTAKRHINPELNRHARNGPFTLRFIINTHSHADHSGGNWLLKSKWGSRILVHRSELRYISNRARALREHFAPIKGNLQVGKDELAKLKDEFGPSTMVDRHLREGSKIQFGGRCLEVLHTPGHSKGSISLYLPKERFLFLGDCLQGSGVKAKFPTLPIYEDVEAYEQTLKRLRKLNVALAFTGHPFLPVRKTKLTSTEYHTLIDASFESFNRLGRTIIEAASHESNPLKITRELMLKSGWHRNDPVSVFVLESVQAFLRSGRWSQ